MTAKRDVSSIVKPDAVAKRVHRRDPRAHRGGRARASSPDAITAAHARARPRRFYAVHRERPFFGDLCEVHDLGPGLRRRCSRARTRSRATASCMGATDPTKAPKGTIRERVRHRRRAERGARLRRARDGARARSPSSSPATATCPRVATAPWAGGTWRLPCGTRAHAGARSSQILRGARRAGLSRQPDPRVDLRARRRPIRAAMTDLPRELRERCGAASRALARRGRAASRAARDGTRKLAARARRRRAHRERAHPRRRPAHALHLLAGRLRDGLRLLRDGAARAAAQPRAPARSSGRSCRARGALATEPTARLTDQSGLHGDGRAARTTRRGASRRSRS